MSGKTGLDAQEWRAASGLAMVYACRMLGLFMAIPVLAVHVEGYPGASPLSIGLAIGVYGLMQALLQVPVGAASDRFGRKRVIYLGLGLFILGSGVAALADSMLGLIVGRALQGCGAIAAVVMALAADLSREQNRSVMMAIIGMVIGLSFIVALVLGPVISLQYGVRAVFWFAAILGVLSLLLVRWWVPSEPPRSAPVPVRALSLRHGVWRLDAGVLLLHMGLTGVFVTLAALLAQAGIAEQALWQLLSLAMLGGLLVLLPLMAWIESGQRNLPGLRLAALVLLGAMLMLASLPETPVALWLAMALMFGGFMLLEAQFPALLSRLAQTEHRGAAMGRFSASQFLGAFLGGLLGGALLQGFGASVTLMTLAALPALWLLMTRGWYIPPRRRPVSPGGVEPAASQT